VLDTGRPAAGQWAMASLMNRIKTFVNSPRGQKLIDQGQQELAKPENQRKLKQLAAKLTKRR
jgi:hypothetical protein